jgi:hypothetical protein
MPRKGENIYKRKDGRGDIFVPTIPNIKQNTPMFTEKPIAR